MYRSLAYIALLLMSPQVFGGVFDPPPTDKSVELLGIIFGATVGDIYLGGAPNSALAEIMEKFNFIIVVAGMLVVSYAGIMSTINTAQEGTVMGKKWSAVWVPMRSIIGMLLMVPSPGTGYSMIQVTVMWIVIQGIGAADQLWTILLENLAVGNSASMGTIGSNVVYNSAGSTLASALLGHALCLEAYHLMSKLPTGEEAPNEDVDKLGNRTWHSQKQHSDKVGDWIANNGSKIKYYKKVTQAAVISDAIPGKGVSGPEGSPFAANKGAIAKGEALFGDSTDGSLYAQVCGRIDIDVQVYHNEWLNAAGTSNTPHPSDAEVLKAAEDIYNIKQQTISTMLTTLQPLANQIVTGEITPKDPGLALAFFQNAIDAYSSLMQSLVIPVETGDIDKTMIELGKQEGWIVAGSYYFTFNKILNSQTFTNSYTEMTSVDISPCLTCGDEDDVEYCLTNKSVDNSTCASLGLIKGFIDEDYALIKVIKEQIAGMLSNPIAFLGSAGLDKETGESAGKMMEVISAGNTEVMEGLANIMEGGGGEPLLAHAAFGKSLMLAAEILWLIAVIALMVGTVVAGSVPFMALGSAVGISMGTMLFGMVAPALGMMWSFGATLAIYLPFIPYMIFTVTALGWLLTVVESIIAAPLIALGLVIPAGDEMGKLSTALMLLANIFLRPMLMIFGFILAANVYKAVITLVNFGMSVVIADVNANTMFSWIGIMLVYVTFIISLANTSFSLIYAVPDKILRWLGGPGDSTNMDAVSKTETGAKQGMSQMGSEIGTSGTAAGKMLDEKSSDAANRAANDKGGGSGGDSATSTPPSDSGKQGGGNSSSSSGGGGAKSGGAPASGGGGAQSGGAPASGGGGAKSGGAPASGGGGGGAKPPSKPG